MSPPKGTRLYCEDETFAGVTLLFLLDLNKHLYFFQSFRDEPLHCVQRCAYKVKRKENNQLVYLQSTCSVKRLLSNTLVARSTWPRCSSLR